MAKARIAVVGAGLMGHGIAQVFAVAGHDVTITDSVWDDCIQAIQAATAATAVCIRPVIEEKDVGR